jgi:putative ABC transport system permease protein
MLRTLRTALRFARRWTIQVWIIPVVCAALLATSAFIVLSRAVPDAEAVSIGEFGGADVLVGMNDEVDPSTDVDKVPGIIERFAEVSGDTACAYVYAFLEDPHSRRATLAYEEQLTGCSPEEWGYQLEAGAWPQRPGEIVATAATGLRPGERLEGIVPAGLTVVGVVASPYSKDANTVFAAPGTWRSWNLPSVNDRFPGLSGIVQIVIHGDADAVERFVDQTYGASVALSRADRPRATIITSFPFVYQWPATAVVALAAALSIALHARTSRSRIELMEDQGVPYRRAAMIVRLAQATALGTAAIAGVTAGWALGWASAPAAEAISNSVASATPLPVDPVVRTAIVMFAAWTVFAVAPSLVRRNARPERQSDVLLRRNALPTVRWCLAVAAALGAIVVFVNGERADGAFGAISLIVLAAGLIAPECLVPLAKRGARGAPAARRLAFRRIAERPASAAVAFTAAAILVGPVTAMLVLMTSALAELDESSALPPSRGQAVYVLSGDEHIDQEVDGIVRRAAGTDAPIVVQRPTTADGRGVVASADGLGGILATDEVTSVGALLGIDASPATREALRKGGVLWAAEDTGTHVWALTEDGAAPQPLTVPATAAQEWDRRWQNEARGLMLTDAIDALGLVSVPTQLVWVGVEESESDTIRDALTAAGLGSDLVETYEADFSHGFGDRESGMLAVLLTLGVVMLVASTWSMATALRRQATSLLALGAPSSWLTRVLLVEGAGPILAGAITGGVVSITSSTAALSVAGTAVVLPWPALGAVIGGTAIVAVASLGINMARARM